MWFFKKQSPAMYTQQALKRTLYWKLDQVIIYRSEIDQHCCEKNLILKIRPGDHTKIRDRSTFFDSTFKNQHWEDVRRRCFDHVPCGDVYYIKVYDIYNLHIPINLLSYQRSQSFRNPWNIYANSWAEGLHDGERGN
jgi:hypothetical protein